MSRLDPLWQDAFEQVDDCTLFLVNLPVPGNPNGNTRLMGGANVYSNVADLKKGIEKAAKIAPPLHAKVTLDPTTLQPRPPFSAFVMFATPDEARQVAAKGSLQLKGIQCPVNHVRPPREQPPSQNPVQDTRSASAAPPAAAAAGAAAADPNTADYNFTQSGNRTVCLRSLPVGKQHPDSLRVTSPKKLMALLEEARYDVEGARLLRDPATGAFTGVGFVTFRALPEARELLKEGSVLLKGTYAVKVSAPKLPAETAAKPTPATQLPASLAPAAAGHQAPNSQPRHASATAAAPPRPSTSAVPSRRFATPPPVATAPNPRGDFIVEFDAGARRYAAQVAAGSALHSRPMVAVPSPPPPQFTNKNHADGGDDVTVNFTAMSWNVLFRDFAVNHKQYCPLPDLTLPGRRGMVHECIRRHRPDILALQELEVADNDSDALYIKEELASAGYEVHAMAKGGGGTGMDGCALAFRRDVFAARRGDVRKDRLSSRFAQVGVCARLHHRASGRQVVVATTHLKAGPEFERERQAQMEELLSGVRHAFLPTRGRPDAADIPVIVLGDLNTEPRWELIPGLEAGSPVGPLRDAYANNKGGAANGPPPGYTDTPFTSYSWFLQGVADYVLHTDGVVPVKVLKVPGTRDVRALYAADYPQRSQGPRFEMLPTKSFPSDHVPLMVEFAFAAPASDQCLLLPPANDQPYASQQPLPPPPPPPSQSSEYAPSTERHQRHHSSAGVAAAAAAVAAVDVAPFMAVLPAPPATLPHDVHGGPSVSDAVEAAGTDDVEPWASPVAGDTVPRDAASAAAPPPLPLPASEPRSAAHADPAAHEGRHHPSRPPTAAVAADNNDDPCDTNHTGAAEAAAHRNHNVRHCDAMRFEEARCDTGATGDGAAPDEVGHDDCARSDHFGARCVVAGATSGGDDVLDADTDGDAQAVDHVDSDDDGGGAAVTHDADDSSSASSSACSIVGDL